MTSFTSTQAGGGQNAQRKGGKTGLIVGAALIGASAIGATTAFCNDACAPMNVPWDHKSPVSGFDHASIRRGFQVYREVCATCHSLKFINYRNLIGVTHTEDEMKAMAADTDVEDGPNDQGEMFDRPGKLSDPLPSPYANDEAGRAANGGASPPDLSLMAKARVGFEDYIFSLMTGYKDVPAGVPELREGLYYNPYFPGGAIGMPPPLQDGQVEYEDGTPATLSQMSKDVCTFLAWAAEPEHEERKAAGIKWVTLFALMAVVTGYHKRFRWSIFKSRKISYTGPP